MLIQRYPTFEEQETDWHTYGLNNTPFRGLVSVILSTMTHTKRTMQAAIALFAERLA